MAGILIAAVIAAVIFLFSYRVTVPNPPMPPGQPVTQPKTTLQPDAAQQIHQMRQMQQDIQDANQLSQDRMNEAQRQIEQEQRP